MKSVRDLFLRNRSKLHSQWLLLRYKLLVVGHFRSMKDRRSNASTLVGPRGPGRNGIVASGGLWVRHGPLDQRLGSFAGLDSFVLHPHLAGTCLVELALEPDQVFVQDGVLNSVHQVGALEGMDAVLVVLLVHLQSVEGTTLVKVGDTDTAVVLIV